MGFVGTYVLHIKMMFKVWWDSIILKHMLLETLRWLLGLRKLRPSKKVECLQVGLVLQVASWKNTFIMADRNGVFLVTFTMKLSSTVLSYLNAHSTLNFAGTFLYFLTLTHIKYQRSKISILQEAAIVLGAAVERCSGSKVLGLQLYFTGVFEDFGHIFTTCSKKFTKILKLGKIFRYVTSFYQHFFVSDPICYYKTNSGN